MNTDNSFVLYGHVANSDCDRRISIYENSYLVCINGKSAGVYKDLPAQYARLPIKHYENKIIVPGMVDLHIHAPQFAFRGMGMDWELIDWLNNQTFPEEAKYADIDYADKAYRIFAECMQKSATTRAVIFATRHRDATILLMDKMETSGLISYVGKVNMDREAPNILKEPGAEESAFDTFGWLNAIEGRYQHTKPILTPRFIPSCSNYLMDELREVRRAYGLPIQSHLSENPGEIEWVKALRPDSAFYGDAYDIHDLFGERNEFSKGAKTVMAHCVWSGEEELQRIKDNGVFIAHCPASNMNLSSGIAPVKKYLNMGLHIGLGSDVAGGQTESIFRAITDAIQVSKMYWRHVDEDIRPLTFDDAFALATRGGGEFFGKVGAFDSGYEFDAIVLNDEELSHPQELNVRQRLERAVYLELDRTGIEAKFVAGRQVI